MITEALAAVGITELIKGLVNKYIIPKVGEIKGALDANYKVDVVPLETHFIEYIKRSYDTYSTINTLVRNNTQMRLNDIYVPLTISSNNIADKLNVRIDSFPMQLISKYKCILVTDTAGMGKSTLVKKLFFETIKENLGIPIFVELRRLSKEKNIIQDINEQVSSISKDFNTDLLYRLIEKGNFIFFFDGYDEIRQPDKSFVTKDIQDFVSKASNNYFFLTSRQETGLTCFGNFFSMFVKPLRKNEAFELLKKYDSNGKTSQLLIELLLTGKYNMIDDFLQNPLLVTLLFAAFDYKQTIPLKKHIFYRQVYDAFFDSHDLSKGEGFIHNKKSNLDIDDFEKVLRRIGYDCFRLQKIEFSKDEILTVINTARRFCSDLTFNNSNFLDDLLTTVPLFCKDGVYYKWTHKSLQEYFAAQFIYKDSKNQQDKILESIFRSKKIDNYLNLLDLYSDIDSYGFEKNVLLPLLNDYENFYYQNYHPIDGITKESIECRISMLFSRKVFLGHHKLEGEDDPFSYLIKKCRELYGISIHRGTRLQSNVYILSSFLSDRKLFDILRLKYSELFAITYQSNQTRYFMTKNDKSFEIDIPDDSIIAIKEIEQFSKNQNEYDECNFYLTSSDNIRFCYLNIDKVKNKTNKIKECINNKENTVDLIFGL